MKCFSEDKICVGLLCGEPEKVAKFFKLIKLVKLVTIDDSSKIDKNCVDVIFVDELPVVQDNIHDIPIVFLAKDKHLAYDVLKLGVVDMIIEPYVQKSFDDAILKLMDYFKGQYMARLNQSYVPEKYPRLEGIYFQYKSVKNSIVSVDFRKIKVCIADGNLTRIFVHENRKSVGDFSIGTLAKILLDCGFVKIHRKFVVNPDFIEDIINSGNGRRSVKIIGHEEILPIARRKWKGFNQIFAKRDRL